MNARDACFGSISFARSFAYAFDSRPSPGVWTNAGSRVVRVAIGVRELQRLDHRVQVVGAVALHRLQVELLEDVERLEQHRALAAERLLVDVVAAVVRRRRLFDPREELGEVVELARRLVLLSEMRPSRARCRPCRSDRAPPRCRPRGLCLAPPRSASTIRVSVCARVGQLDRLAGLVRSSRPASASTAGCPATRR